MRPATRSEPTERVALFAPDARGGGAERVVVRLAQGLAESGLRVDLVLAKARGPYLAEIPARVRVVDLGAERVVKAFWPLRAYLKRERPRALLATLAHANIIAALAWKCSARSATRLVLREAIVGEGAEVESPSWRRCLGTQLQRLTYRWAHRVVGVSDAVALDLIHRLHVQPERVRVVWNPVYSPELDDLANQPCPHPWFADHKRPVIVGVGRLTSQKSFGDLIAAVAMVREVVDVRLVILGDGTQRPELAELVRFHRLGEVDAVLPGFVLNPLPYMRQAAMVVLPSRREGLPNVLIQALAVGTPVVATDAPGGSREVLGHGAYGRLVSVGDPKALATAIKETLQEGWDPEVLRSRGREFSVLRATASYRELLVGGCGK